MGGAAAPLHPLRVVQDGLGAGDGGASEEHDQVVVAAGDTKNFVQPRCEGDTRRSARCSRLQRARTASPGDFAGWPGKGVAPAETVGAIPSGYLTSGLHLMSLGSIHILTAVSLARSAAPVFCTVIMTLMSRLGRTSR